ncbi:hypothetical protein LJR230_001328 [Trinickia sp. LjRoot230]|uniref:hypothetical protein n=1 Tax=Trinickia sp. LjRoot230 TaxID=3342288 RepID=UPI003ECC58BC
MTDRTKLLFSTSLTVPDVVELGKLYQRALGKDDRTTALAAEQAVLRASVGEGALAEARTLAAFLDQV